ncbi:MAG: carboxylesterase family protein [Sphingobium sp.]
MGQKAEEAGERRLIDAPCGAVSGLAAPGAWLYRAIPFAQAPVAALRFCPPAPHPGWTGVHAADHWPAPPMQGPSVPPVVAPDTPDPSEDCLYLNVWTPREGTGHPVFVWVHGGANIVGSSSMPVFDGARFAAQGIVCVTLTYRVGAFGFLELGDVLGEAYRGSGLNGLRDIAAGLDWVHANIAAFGGDPDRITIGGQSAGAKNIAALVASDLLRIPLHGVISQSGGGQTVATPEEGALLCREMLRALDVGADDAVRLLTMPPQAFLDAQANVVARYPHKFPFRPVVDGQVLPATPLAGYEAGRSARIPMLIGHVRDESPVGGPALPRDGTVASGQLANMTLEDFHARYAAYAGLYPSLDAEGRKYRALAAEEYGVPSLRLAEAHVRNGGACWVYRFDLPSAQGHSAGLCRHGSELPLTWDKLDDPLSCHLGPVGPVAQEIGALMHGAWVAFLHRQTPSTAAFAWPAYRLEDRLSARFGAEAVIVADLDRDERLIWEGWPRAVA